MTKRVFGRSPLMLRTLRLGGEKATKTWKNMFFNTRRGWRTLGERGMLRLNHESTWSRRGWRTLGERGDVAIKRQKLRL